MEAKITLVLASLLGMNSGQPWTEVIEVRSEAEAKKDARAYVDIRNRERARGTKPIKLLNVEVLPEVETIYLDDDGEDSEYVEPDTNVTNLGLRAVFEDITDSEPRRMYTEREPEEVERTVKPIPHHNNHDAYAYEEPVRKSAPPENPNPFYAPSHNDFGIDMTNNHKSAHSDAHKSYHDSLPHSNIAHYDHAPTTNSDPAPSSSSYESSSSSSSSDSSSSYDSSSSSSSDSGSTSSWD